MQRWVQSIGLWFKEHLSSPWRCGVFFPLLPGFFGYLGENTGPMPAPYTPAGEVKERSVRIEKRGFYRTFIKKPESC